MSEQTWNSRDLSSLTPDDEIVALPENEIMLRFTSPSGLYQLHVVYQHSPLKQTKLRLRNATQDTTVAESMMHMGTVEETAWFVAFHVNDGDTYQVEFWSLDNPTWQLVPIAGLRGLVQFK